MPDIPGGRLTLRALPPPPPPPPAPTGMEFMVWHLSEIFPCWVQTGVIAGAAIRIVTQNLMVVE